MELQNLNGKIGQLTSQMDAKDKAYAKEISQLQTAHAKEISELQDKHSEDVLKKLESLQNERDQLQVRLESSEKEKDEWKVSKAILLNLFQRLFCLRHGKQR